MLNKLIHINSAVLLHDHMLKRVICIVHPEIYFLNNTCKSIKKLTIYAFVMYLFTLYNRLAILSPNIIPTYKNINNDPVYTDLNKSC